MVINAIIVNRDYLLFKDCMCVLFGDLEVTPSEDSMSLETHAKHIWRRRDTAEQLGMSEDSLIDWCILIGNDFTEEYSRDMYCEGTLISRHSANVIVASAGESNNHTHSSQPRGSRMPSPPADTLLSSHSVAAIHMLKDIVKSHLASSRLYSSDMVLQYAIECSRDYYDMRGLPSLAMRGEDGCIKTEDMSVMSSVEREAMVQWLNFNLQSSSAYDDLLAAVITGLRELSGHGNSTTFQSTKCDNKGKGAIIVGSTSKKKRADEQTLTRCFSDVISIEHVVGFEKMLDRIHDFDLDEETPCSRPGEIPAIVREDVMAVHTYQESCLILHQLIKQHPKISDDDRKHLLYYTLVGDMPSMYSM